MFCPRADLEDAGSRPGDMPEGDDGAERQALVNHLRRQREVIVLDQHDWRAAGRLVADGAREARVDGAIGGEVAGTEHPRHMDAMAERPECFVGETVVIAPLLRIVEPDTPQSILRIGGWHPDAVTGVDREPIAGPGAV